MTPNGSNTVEPGMIVLVDNEEIFCSAVSGNECTSAKRGYGGTTATTHSQGALWAGSVHIQYHATRDPGYTGKCTYTDSQGQLVNVECVFIDYLYLNYSPSLSYGANDTYNDFHYIYGTQTINGIQYSALEVPAASLGSTYPDRVFNQEQIDVAHGIGSTPDPVKVGEYIDEDNVTASWGVLGSSSCAVP